MKDSSKKYSSFCLRPKSLGKKRRRGEIDKTRLSSIRKNASTLSRSPDEKKWEHSTEAAELDTARDK